MPRSALRTRVKAAVLRRFRGRPSGAASWEESPPQGAGAPLSFSIAELAVRVTPRGLKAAGKNQPSIVYDVIIEAAGPRPRRWSSSYGFAPREASAERAANAALDELDEVARDPAAWLRTITAGMSEEEAEAIGDSLSVTQDLDAAGWVGPQLVPLRNARREGGGWWVGAEPSSPAGGSEPPLAS